jgi:hypothetical protein
MGGTNQTHWAAKKLTKLVNIRSARLSFRFNAVCRARIDWHTGRRVGTGSFVAHCFGALFVLQGRQARRIIVKDLATCGMIACMIVAATSRVVGP